MIGRLRGWTARTARGQSRAAATVVSRREGAPLSSTDIIYNNFPPPQQLFLSSNLLAPPNLPDQISLWVRRVPTREPFSWLILGLTEPPAHLAML